MAESKKEKELKLKEKDILAQIAEGTQNVENLARQMYAELGKVNYLKSLLEDK